MSAICPPSSGLFNKVEAFGLDSQETQEVNLKTVQVKSLTLEFPNKVLQ